MTKRSLYARLALLTCAGWLQAAGAAAQPPAGTCAACIAVVTTPGQGVLLPETLHGITVLLRATPDKTSELPSGVEHVRTRGGRPGILVTPDASGTSADAAYRLKLWLTELRGAVAPDVLIALEDTGDLRRRMGRSWDELAAYADVIVTPRDAPPVEGRRAWPRLAATTAAEALAATTGGTAEQWVVTAPVDVIDARSLLHELAQAAAPPPDAFTEEVVVSAARRLTAREIVARHQAVARRQASAVARTIATGVMTLTFEAPGFPAPVTITSDTVIYQGRGRTEIEQRAIRVNGIEFKGAGVPRLPILEPERVATPPLSIALTDLYRYELRGDETVRGIRCYVVAFEPVDQRATLFRGRAWIAMDGFAAVRIAGTQTALRGPIVSSEQIDEFREVQPGTWLLVRSDVRQIYEGAAHRTPIERVLAISGYEVNPADFEARLQAAYASPSLMLRDTAEGYRYLKRERADGAPAGGAAAGGPPVTTVEVATKSSRVRTIAAGVIIDPNISIPLPFAGVSYVDFDLFGTGTQFNGFFGGSYAQLAVSVPSLGGSRWQLAGRAFGIASSYNDRSFRGGREIYEENIRQRPAHASVWLLRPLSPRLSLRAGYELDYTRLRRAPETAAGFVAPSDQVVHGARLALEGQRDGWAGSIWWNPARRTGWRPWGRGPEDYQEGDDTFQRFGATLARSTAVTPSVVLRAEGALMSGRDLDRFSRYTFGTFDNRLRGYPAALVRYDRGGVLRGTVAWSMSRFARVDGFVDTAVVRDPGFGTRYRNYTGVGAALEAPMPFGILAAAEWGYGFRGVNADGGLGTHVIRISAFKVF